ncbi:MAG: sigma-70 family RNA polymerase sigma factor [Cytophagales bacterium]|jgi:RNA polymerase sigma factor (sigma-70 family)|nr:sigma-70 family RNA polymerase sigma factor [Cytophagales bacterium]
MNNDALLWQAFREGDRAAYEQIYRMHAKGLCEYAYRFRLDQQTVHDCLQDLFVELWVKRERLSATDSINFYLMKALRNRLLRVLENQKRLTGTPDADHAFELNALTDNRTWMEEQQETERNRQLQQAIGQLTDRQREAVYLRFYQNLDYIEIAEMMSLEQQSVYNLVFRALQVLRKKLSSAWLFGLLLAACLVRL